MPFDDTMFIKRNVNVLSFFSDEQIREITQDVDRQVFKKGQTIMFQGEVNSNFYIIKRGSVEVHAKSGGEKALLATLAPGDFFGEMSILESTTANATIKSAEDDTVILMVPHDVFLKFLHQNPGLELALRERMADRKRQKHKVFEDRKPHPGGEPPPAAPPEGGSPY